tara:strand:- start:8218 stop:9108 length:891 start_codon:yes stop_codon:yes gene_type:complete
MSEELISVIIPTYNREKLLRRAIQSVQRQSYENWEIIVVDNHSEDDTQLFIESLSSEKIKYIKHKNNGIIASSRNIGAEVSKGNFLAFLDSDDWWEKDKLKKSHQALTSTESDISYHNCFIEGNKKNGKTRSRKLKDPIYNDLLINGNTIVTSSVLIRKKIFKNAGCFSTDEDKVGWEDYDLWIKVSKNKGKFHFIEERLGFYWVGDDNFDDPKRILLNIDNMKKTIISEFINLYGGVPWWPSYTSGIAFFNLGQNKDSLKYFFKVIFSQSPLKSKLKSLFYIVKILLKKRFKNEE